MACFFFPLIFFRLRRQGNEYLLYFFAENALRVRFSILASIVHQLFAYDLTTTPISIPSLGTKIGSLFIVLENNIVGFLLPGQTDIGVKVAGDVLERYAIDNYGWGTKPDVFETLSQCSRNITSTKQSCCSLMHMLFLWSAALYGTSFFQEHIGARVQHVYKIFCQRPSSHAKIQKRNNDNLDEIVFVHDNNNNVFTKRFHHPSYEEEDEEEEPTGPLKTRRTDDDQTFLEWEEEHNTTTSSCLYSSAASSSSSSDLEDRLEGFEF